LFDTFETAVPLVVRILRDRQEDLAYRHAAEVVQTARYGVELSNIGLTNAPLVRLLATRGGAPSAHFGRRSHD
jgi:hypothetical protein